MHVARRGPRLGLIPAHAGKTVLSKKLLGASRAHPRSRGENNCESMTVAKVGGSSPLTRGKREILGGDLRGGGLIPAHAGKTCAAPMPVARSGAHPRSRGENFEATDKTVDDEGSSPLTRGKHVNDKLGANVAGLIPAHAGKTRAATVSVIH